MPTSLLSVTIGVVLLTLVASAVAPLSAASQSERLRGVALTIQAAIERAQQEALTEETPHAVRFEPATQTFTVFAASIASEPAAVIEVSRHPLSKQPYVLTIDDAFSLSPGNNLFSYSGAAAANDLIFDSWGTPLIMSGGSRFQLDTTQIDISDGTSTQTLSITPYTGQVSIQ